jgi:hypothetical protein
MRFKNASMEIVPIIIVILSLFTGIQPTAINSNHSIANVASNDLNLKLEPKIDLANVT